MWNDNSVADLGHHPISNYTSVLDDSSNPAVISQQRLISKMIGLWINNSLTANAKRKLRAFKYAYSFNSKDYGATMFLVIVKIV